MSEHVASRGMDISMAWKRAVWRGVYRFGWTLPGRWLGAAIFSAKHPALALAEGEALVSRPWRVLALTSHPDDLEFFCGGTLRRLALSGCDIRAVCLTDGEKRGNWTSVAQRRRTELETAARIVGYRQVAFYGLPDFGLPEDPRVEQIVADAWQRHRPDLVLAFDPKELLPNVANRDHKALGRTVMDYARRNPGGARVCFYGTHQPNLLVDIGPVLETKIEAVLAHRSQMVYLSLDGYAGAVKLQAMAAAHKTGRRYAEGLYRLL